MDHHVEAALQLLVFHMAAFGFSLLATWALARLAPRLGWGDAGDGVRKLQAVPLAPVGGGALTLALVATLLLVSVLGRVGVSPSATSTILGVSVWPLGALASALLVGLVDDRVRGGLRPSQKLVGQVLAGMVLVSPGFARGLGEPMGWLAALGLAGGAVVSMNVINTWDNADGAAAGLGMIALPSVVSAALAGFLMCNLRRRDGRPLLRGLTHATLGDAGSHLLGMALWLSPMTWPALALPLADLARVVHERARARQAPWVGDRRHLAHRLERRGLAPWAVALALALAALPSGRPAGNALDTGRPLEAALWTLATFALGAGLWAATRRAGDPCREPGGPG
jgi:UDP-N-acetylmuramyl pentapeptide phosphotransferase/UDP-N-acetylglucosamine-1-phosphate transferase